jgi:hypothetical protein
MESIPKPKTPPTGEERKTALRAKLKGTMLGKRFSRLNKECREEKLNGVCKTLGIDPKKLGETLSSGSIPGIPGGMVRKRKDKKKKGMKQPTTTLSSLPDRPGHSSSDTFFPDVPVIVNL